MKSTQATAMSRRDFLKGVGTAGAGLFLAQFAAGCGPTPTPTSAPASPTKAPAPAPTPTTAKARTELRVGQYSEPTSLDPFMTTTVIQAMVQHNIFTPLCYLDFKTLQPVPALAESWTHPDPLTWRFKLREGVQFHKGYGEVTAEDVAFNVNVTVQENKPRKFLYFFVEGAKAVDKYVVEFKLSKPFTPFLITTAVGQGTWVIPQKAFKEMGADAYGRNPVGCGPFEFVSWEPGSAITLKKFDKYWKKDRPYLEKLVYYPVVDTNIKRLRLVNGELDLIDQPDFKDIAEFKANPNLTVARSVGWAWDALTFNLDLPGDHPIKKKEVRQAIAYAIDREEIAAAAYFGSAVPDDNPLPPGYLASQPGVHLYENKANATKAKELLAKAGYPNGFSVKGLVEVRYAQRRSMEIIASQLSKVGIQVQIEQEAGSALQRMINRQFEMGFIGITVMTPDPDSALYWFQHTKTVANFGYQNAAVDEDLDKAREESDNTKRADMYTRVLKNVLEDSPYVFTCHREMVWAHHKKLTGFVPQPQDYALNFEDVRWEP